MDSLEISDICLKFKQIISKSRVELSSFVNFDHNSLEFTQRLWKRVEKLWTSLIIVHRIVDRLDLLNFALNNLSL